MDTPSLDCRTILWVLDSPNCFTVLHYIDVAIKLNSFPERCLQILTILCRFDVRAHLDYIREPVATKQSEKTRKEEAKMNYERYRILVYNKHR